jgi:pimeloyl-ACP methyl ester carboxylesterase
MALLDGVVKAPWVTPFSTLVRDNIEVFEQVPAHIHRQLLIGHLRSAIHGEMSEAELEPYLEPWLGETGQSAYYRQVAQFDEQYTDEIEPLYSSIEIPTLVAWGDNDEWLDFEVGEWLADEIPVAEFSPIPDAGHFVPEDNPERVAAVIDEFFGSDL